MGACNSASNKSKHRHLSNTSANLKLPSQSPNDPLPKDTTTSPTFLICANCKSTYITLKQITYKNNDNYVFYKCICSPNQTKESPLHSMLTTSNHANTNNTCATHSNQLITCYCNTCEIYLCNTCKDTSHQGHSMFNCDELKQKINDNTTQQILNNINNEDKQRNDLYDETKRNINNKFNALINEIQSLQNNMLSSLDAQNDKCKNTLMYLQTLFNNNNKNDNKNDSDSVSKMKQIEFINEMNLLNKAKIISNNNNCMNIIDKYIDDIKQQNNTVEFGYQFHTDNMLSKSSKLLASQHILSESMNKSNVKPVALNNNYPNLNEEQNTSIHEAYSKPANTYENHNNNNNNKIDTSIKPLEYAYEIRGHENKVITLTLLSSGKLASGSYDKTIRIWNIHQYITEKTLIEDGSVLSLLEFEPDKLLSGTNVNTINLWSLGDYRKMFTFNGHILWVNCLVKLTNILFASCSNDSIINIWNFNTLQKVYTLEEHNDCVLTMIKLTNGELCSGSADNSIKIWNWKQESCVHTLEGHKQWVKCLCELDNGDILSGSDDKTIKVWRDLKCLMTLEGHESPVRALFKMNERYFLSGSFDNSIRVWEVNGDVIECTQIEKRHKDNVITIIKGNGNKIFSSSNDCSIIEWKWKCN